MGIKIKGYLADHEDSPSGIALHGTVSAAALEHGFADNQLKVGHYQREIRSEKKLLKLVMAIKSNTVLPPIMFGMRGSRFVSPPGSDDFELADDVYIVDGLQRTYAGITVHRGDQSTPVFLPVVVYFNTDEPWERKYFKLWNTSRLDPAASIHLRNAKEEHAAMATLYGLSTTDRSFALFGKVCWDQTPKSEEIIRATTLVKVAIALSGFSAAASRNVDTLIATLDRAAEIKGLSNLRNNTRKFFDLIDYCWDLHSRVRKDSVMHSKDVFLLALASVMARSPVFWDDDDRKVLSVSYEVRRKLKTMNLSGEPLERLIRSGSYKMVDYIADVIVRHINKGKTSRRIVMDGVATAAEEEEVTS